MTAINVFPSTFQGATIGSGALGNNGQSTPHHPPSHSNDTQTRDWLNQIDTFYSTITSQVLQEFATTPDVDGGMLLDNTIVVYVTEVRCHCRTEAPAIGRSTTCGLRLRPSSVST